VQSVLNDLDNAPISEKDRTLYAFIRKMVSDSTSIGPSDVSRAREAGWTDEALYDAITVCSLFQFYNNWIDATGVGDMPVLGYEMSGHRLATEGYASEPRPEIHTEPTRSRRSKGARRSKRSTAVKASKRSTAAKAAKRSTAVKASRKSKRSSAKVSKRRRRR
jgi:hypothetical protein